ncbi:carbamoyltransferase family protein [Geopsychrobacter electrodiphilus]|uniref:carbamoyltransferase family protein n=1 Tax=Geopsychrobacter electrodiphilus TaxID=225196 RepID=UPI0003806D12|nr:carbamoyltransferase [Geopsychrobacter electrodiphilus]
MPDAILGISAFYHDSAAALILDGKIVAAAQEERFTRKKHDSSFPRHAVAYVLEEAGLELADISAVAFYDKPYLKFERLLETYHSFAPRGLKSFLSAIPVWIKEKLFMRRMLRDEFKKLGGSMPKLLFPEHHLSHAASAFYPSPFSEAAILTLDGVGEWATCSIGVGTKNGIRVLKELDFPHSLGLLYSAFTHYCGFKVNSGEYKLMGLAPYGTAGSPRVEEWKKHILTELVDLREDGSFLLNMDYFDYATGLTMCVDNRWQKLFGIPRHTEETALDQNYMDLALAIQEVTEQIVLRLAHTARQLTQSDYLVMAGGVALNCVANGKLLRSGLFKDIWIQPASGDAGGALGAALAGWHISLDKPRQKGNGDAMQGALLGPEYGTKEIGKVARRYQAPCQNYAEFSALCHDVAGLLAEGQVVGWFQGRMEYGPRALGNRSILGDARHPEMQKKLNLKIKYREGFRPFAPSVIDECVGEFFDLDRPSPYMLLVAPVRKERRSPLPNNYHTLPLYDRLYHTRSDVPTITHIDYSARIQSVNREGHPKYWELIDAFRQQTGYGLIVNTSFNVRGEPIVCTPDDAYRCFMATEMDYLVMGDFLFCKNEQPHFADRDYWKQKYALD